jgi:hypothetical protein
VWQEERQALKDNALTNQIHRLALIVMIFVISSSDNALSYSLTSSMIPSK